MGMALEKAMLIFPTDAMDADFFSTTDEPQPHLIIELPHSQIGPEAAVTSSCNTKESCAHLSVAGQDKERRLA